MARQAISRLQGDDYQHLFSWLRILELKVSHRRAKSVILEASDAGSIDDVAVYPADETGPTEYWQVRFHVNMRGAYSADMLISKESKGATSLLEKFWRAWRQLSSSSPNIVLGLVSNWTWDPSDPVGTVLGGHNHHLKPEFLTARTPRRLVDSRRKWQEHLDASAGDFAKFARALRLRVGFDCYEELVNRIKERMMYLGLRRDDAALLAAVGQVREWIKSGSRVVTEELLDSAIDSLGLVMRSAGDPPIVISLHTIERQRFDYDADYELDWCEYFEGDFPKGHRLIDPTVWNTKLLGELRALKNEINRRRERVLRVQGQARLSAWFAAGFTFSEVARYILEVRQGKEYWRSDARPSENFTTVAREDTSVAIDVSSPGIAVGISVTGSLEEDVLRYLRRAGPPVRAVYFLSPNRPLGRNTLSSERDAVALAQQSKQHIQTWARTQEAERVHLFYFGPLAGAAFLGHGLNAVGAEIQIYEDQAPGYARSFLLL